MSITVTGLGKRFGAFTALDDISLEIPAGELVALLGPSGSGKTTLLRLIAGLETPDRGTISLQGRDATTLSPQRRQVGFVFKHYALFRHLSVLENVAFGLRVKPRRQRPPRAEILRKAHELLSLVQLDGCADRLPEQLSGGQRQRVALARALAVEPEVLLLDEPFGALDAQVRKELRRWLRRLHDEIGLTSVFVTHDQEEALELADRVVVFNRGHIEQVGTPQEVYHRPASPFVHRFLGSVNVFHGRVLGGEYTKVGDLMVRLDQDPPADGEVSIFVRPHDVEIARRRDPICLIPALVREVVTAGPVVRVELERRDDQRRVSAEISHERLDDLRLKVGDEVFIGFWRYGIYDRRDALADYQI